MLEQKPSSVAGRALPMPVLGPIDATRLQPPRSARRPMPREALLARLLEARRRACVVVQGPAGSGKTSVLVAWRQALLSLDFDVAWLSLSTEDNHATRFFDCLVASLGAVDPDIVREAALLMGRDASESAREHWVISLVQSLSRHPRELVLMLDDVHLLDDSCIFQVLQWLLEYAPAQFHLVLCSRGPLPLSLSRLRSQGQLAEFDLRDLRFSAEESERFLREQLGSIDRRDAQVLHELTDGWAAGLQLFALDLRKKHGAGFVRMEVRDAHAFASYFEREVLVRLVPDELELLTRMAACNRFSAPLCAALVGQAHAVAQMTTRLVRLDAENLFISQVSSPDGERWYRLHPLLREVLLTRSGGLDQEAMRELHRRAWRWFDAHGQIDDAVRHALAAGDPQAAADMVEARAADLMAKGALTRLAGLMHGLPDEQVQASFTLCHAHAHLRLMARDLGAVERSLARFDAQAATLTLQQRYALTQLRGGLAMQRDDTEAVRSMLPELLAIPADAGSLAFTGRSYVIAWLYMYDGEYAQAREVLDDLAAHGASPGRRMIGRCLEGMSHSIEGRIVEAERIFREVLVEAEGQGAADIGVACMAAGLLGDALYELGELEEACRLLDPRIEVLERVSLPDTVLRGLLVLSSASWLLGRRLEAREHLERLEDYGTRNALPRLLVPALGLRQRWHLKLGEIDEAEAVLARIATAAPAAVSTGRGAAVDIGRCIGRARADMCLHWNDFDAAVAVLEPLVAQSRAGGRWRAVAGLHLQLALAERGRGNTAMVRRHLLDALQLGHRLGLVRTLLDVDRSVPTILEHLLSEGTLDPVLAFYVRRLLNAGAQARRQRVSRPSAGTAAAPSLSERELQVLSLVAQAMPNKKIARVLAVTPHTVKWHLAKIYAKLGVTERDQAVARLRDLAIDLSVPKTR